MVNSVADLIELIEAKGKEKGLSRTQLAGLLGVSENYLYRLKDGSRKPGARFLGAVARELNMEKEVVMYMKNYPENDDEDSRP